MTYKYTEMYIWRFFICLWKHEMKLCSIELVPYMVFS